MTTSAAEAELQIGSLRLTSARAISDPVPELEPAGFNRQHCPQCVPIDCRRDSMASISKVRGVGPAIEKALAEQGFNSAEDMAAATPERLNKVPGIGAATAPRLIAAAKAAVASESPSSDDGPRRSEKSKPATEPAEPGKKKAAKPKKKDKKSGRKSKEKADKKGKGKPADKGGKKKSRKGKARRNA